MITEIFVEGKKLDITADISSLLTFALDDVKDFSTRATTFSKTIVLPGTTNNNGIFGNIFDTSTTNAYDPSISNIGYNFNASKSAACIIFQDYLQTFKGTLRLLEIDIDMHRVEYQVALNGNLTTLNVSLTNSLLTNLDFSAYDQLYTAANIIASWDNPGGSGVYFPLADLGLYGAINGNNKHDWDIRTFRPALYAKEYIDKMFAKAGFRYDCDLFNTHRFKSIIVPHNKQILQGIGTRLADAKLYTPYTVVIIPAALTDPGAVTLTYNSLSATNFSFGTFIGYTNGLVYNGTTTLLTVIGATMHGTYSSSGNTLNFEFLIYDASSGVMNTLDTRTFPPTGGVTKPLTVFFDLSSIRIVPNARLAIHVYETGTSTSNVRLNVTSSELTIDNELQTVININPGDKIQMNAAIPNNIRQIDFLVSIVKLWNLYIYEDQFDDRLIHIRPFISFYEQGATSVINWTYKLDRNQMVSIKPMSELNSKIYNFSYADDSDYYNDLYKKRYNQGYGSYIFDSQFEFTTASNTLQVIFAATPLVGYVGEDKVYPTIFKLSGTTEQNVDSVIRIMQTVKVYGVRSWKIKDGTTVLSTITSYGYAGHYDNPNNPDNDLNFGGLNELFYRLTIGVLSKTQFNIYWSAYMAEITDKDSKLLTAKFYLTPVDIFNLSFSKFVYLDGALWRLNKIIDYNASLPSNCEVQLLKAINTAYSYPIGSIPEAARTLDWETGDDLEYTTGNPILYL